MTLLIYVRYTTSAPVTNVLYHTQPTSLYSVYPLNVCLYLLLFLLWPTDFLVSFLIIRPVRYRFCSSYVKLANCCHKGTKCSTGKHCRHIFLQQCVSTTSSMLTWGALSRSPFFLTCLLFQESGFLTHFLPCRGTTSAWSVALSLTSLLGRSSTCMGSSA